MEAHWEVYVCTTGVGVCGAGVGVGVDSSAFMVVVRDVDELNDEMTSVH